MSTMFSFVTFSCTSARLEVDGVSSTSGLISEARIGPVIWSIFSLLALFFRLYPARFHHLSRLMTISLKAGCPRSNDGYQQKSCTSFGAFNTEGQ
jgi:hypothetical protein